MKIYLACSLTHAPEDFKAKIFDFRESLKTEFEILEFLGLEKGTPKDVYHQDTKCVREADLIVADCTYPAIGLGFEIALALQLGKKVLAIAEDKAKVTRLILGINEPNYKFVRYTNINEIKEIVKKYA